MAMDERKDKEEMRIFKNLGYPIGKSLSPIEPNDIEDTFIIFANRYEMQSIEEAVRMCAQEEISTMINDALHLEEKKEKLYYDALLNREATAKEIWEHTSQMLADWKEQKEKEKNETTRKKKRSHKDTRI